MEQSQPKKQTSSHSEHVKEDDAESDCEDCRHEREQNKLLVNMYEKLKHIQGKVERVQSTLKSHLKQTSHDVLNLSSIGNKVEGLHGSSGSEGSTAQVGLELAKQLIERRARDKLEQENRQLKQIIQKIRIEQAKQYEIAEQNRKEQSKLASGSSSIYITERTIKIQHNPNQSRPINNPETQTPQLSKIMDDTHTEYLQSQSSQFAINTNRKEPKKNIIPELSLWLFDNIENSRLENELYNNSNRDFTTKNKSYFQKKRNSRYGNLPIIRQRSESRRKDSKLDSSRFENKLPVINRKK